MLTLVVALLKATPNLPERSSSSAPSGRRVHYQARWIRQRLSKKISPHHGEKPAPTKAKQLQAAGISKKQSEQWETLAAVLERQFEAAIDARRRSKRSPNASSR